MPDPPSVYYRYWRWLSCQENTRTGQLHLADRGPPIKRGHLPCMMLRLGRAWGRIFIVWYGTYIGVWRDGTIELKHDKIQQFILHYAVEYVSILCQPRQSRQSRVQSRDSTAYHVQVWLPRVAVATNAHYRRCCSAGAPTESLAVCVTLHLRLSNPSRNRLAISLLWTKNGNF